MSDTIEDIIRKMSEEDIARIRGEYNDPMFQKNDEIYYRDKTWKVVDYDLWHDGNPRYVLRPLGEDWVESHGREIVDAFAQGINEREEPE